MYIVLFIVILIVVLACINKKPVQESQAISIPSIDSTENKRRKELKYIRYNRLCRHKRIWAVLRVIKEYETFMQSQSFYDLEKAAEKFNEAKERLLEEDFRPSQEHVSAAIRFCRLQAKQAKCNHYISVEDEHKIYDREHFGYDSYSVLKQVEHSFKCYWDEVLSNYKRQSDKNKRINYIIKHLAEMKTNKTLMSIPHLQEILNTLIDHYTAQSLEGV